MKVIQTTLKEIRYSGGLKKGNLVKFFAVFQNVGKVDTTAKFIAEIYKDGELVDTITSEETLVQRYKQKSLDAYYKIEENGEYLQQKSK